MFNLAAENANMDKNMLIIALPTPQHSQPCCYLLESPRTNLIKSFIPDYISHYKNPKTLRSPSLLHFNPQKALLYTSYLFSYIILPQLLKPICCSLWNSVSHQQNPIFYLFLFLFESSLISCY